MQEFSGINYIKIDIANQFGMDKFTWKDRITWVDKFRNSLQNKVELAEHPILFYKAIKALKDAENNIPTGFIMGLDATASGIQIMAALMGCLETGKATNLVNTGKREDIYQNVADKMGIALNKRIPRNMVKKPIMTTFYGSINQPKSVFGEDDLLDTFYKYLINTAPGAVDCLNLIQSYWGKNKYVHTWSLPDGHTAYVRVHQKVDHSIKIDELNTEITYRSYENIPIKRGLSLCANVIHSIDGYIVRRMYQLADIQNFELITIHDSFWASPNYMNNVRKNYNTILSEICSKNILNSILKELLGNNINTDIISPNKGRIKLSQEILDCDYSLS